MAYSALLSGNCGGEGGLDLTAKREGRRKKRRRPLSAVSRMFSADISQPGCGRETAGGRGGGGSPP